MTPRTVRAGRRSGQGAEDGSFKSRRPNSLGQLETLISEGGISYSIASCLLPVGPGTIFDHSVAS